MKWTGQSGPRDGGCTVSSASCFGVRSVKGTTCSPHKHFCKLGTVTTPVSPPVFYLQAAGTHFVKGTAEFWAPATEIQPKSVWGLDLDSGI